MGQAKLELSMRLGFAEDQKQSPCSVLGLRSSVKAGYEGKAKSKAAITGSEAGMLENSKEHLCVIPQMTA